MARCWRDVKDALAWPHCADRDAQQVSGGDVWQADDARTLQARTGDAYGVKAIHALSS
jgi:hypothetical protein